jgi:arsenate reductase (glutaredoxin)
VALRRHPSARIVVHSAAMSSTSRALVLSYAGCSTCKKALRWLEEHGVRAEVRPIVEQPPTAAELAAWIPKSKKPVRKWLNTSGQSYRALDKERVASAKDDELTTWLTKDGKLVKRPVVVIGRHVLVGFDEDAYAAALGG